MKSITTPETLTAFNPSALQAFINHCFEVLASAEKPATKTLRPLHLSLLSSCLVVPLFEYKAENSRKTAEARLLDSFNGMFDVIDPREFYDAAGELPAFCRSISLQLDADDMIAELELIAKLYALAQSAWLNSTVNKAA
ncbi:MAG: hypothetical protein HYZ15_13080 [Sphingobacteriales bacterium]|nr:hypothetical protein [Sphingobacteriales bacterium]